MRKRSEIQKKNRKVYNIKVKPKDLTKGDLVLRNAQLIGIEQDKGKLSPNWENLYIILSDMVLLFS